MAERKNLEKYFDGEQELTVEIYSNGAKYYYNYYYNSKGQHHRLDGPAYERYDGYKAWFKNDKLHRIDGPAVEHPDGRKSWWLEGKEIDCFSQEKFERYLKVLILK